jgi:hypothetical protein
MRGVTDLTLGGRSRVADDSTTVRIGEMIDDMESRRKVAMTFASFEEWVEREVLPLHSERPGWQRLDGKMTGGNRTPFAFFLYGGKRWRVNSDS